jgi:6-pyruvoyltetrahydropterin/6-carboxytetrahydropterin synthase
MLETFKEFTFEAAHRTPPFSGIHGHSFYVTVYMRGEPDPVYGWSHNLFEVETIVDEIRGRLDNSFLNEIDGLDVPSLENVARWLWGEFDSRIPGLDRVLLRRGSEGQREGCTYSGTTCKELTS